MGSLRFAIALLAGLVVSTPAQDSPSATLQGLQSPPPGEQPRNVILTLEQRGDILMARRMYRDAIELYLQGPKDDPVLWNKMGIAYHQLNQLDKAKKHYERAIKLRKTYAEAHNNLGTVHYAAKSYRRAVNAYKKALEIQPNSASFHMNLGTAYFARKKLKEAMEEYQTALQLDPQVFEYRGGFGTILQERNIEERAKFNYTLAKIYAKSSRFDLAMQHLRRALEEGFKEKNMEKIAEEPEFTALRELPEFKDLLAREPRVL